RMSAFIVAPTSPRHRRGFPPISPAIPPANRGDIGGISGGYPGGIAQSRAEQIQRQKQRQIQRQQQSRAEAIACLPACLPLLLLILTMLTFLFLPLPRSKGSSSPQSPTPEIRADWPGAYGARAKRTARSGCGRRSAQAPKRSGLSGYSRETW